MRHGILPAMLAGAIVTGCAPVAIVGTGALVTTSVIQERSTMDALTDQEIALGVQTRLGNHSGELYRDVFVDVTEGSVVLTGSVPRADDKVAATRAAWATPGVDSVTDEITLARDAGTRAYLEDVRISNAVRYALVSDWSVRSVNYTVTTVDRTVHLTGIARSDEELGRAVAHAGAVPGVARVVSHVLTINDPRRVSRAAKSG